MGSRTRYRVTSESAVYFYNFHHLQELDKNEYVSRIITSPSLVAWSSKSMLFSAMQQITKPRIRQAAATKVLIF